MDEYMELKFNDIDPEMRFNTHCCTRVALILHHMSQRRDREPPHVDNFTDLFKLIREVESQDRCVYLKCFYYDKNFYDDEILNFANQQVENS